MNPTLFIWLQYLLPQRLLSRFAEWMANRRWIWLKNKLITDFIQDYQVDMSIAESDQLSDYPTFNAFFTRALKINARPIAPQKNIIVSPVDGCISQIGRIENNTLLQAKGRDYTLEALLSHPLFAKKFYQGYFATLYLSPKDYHRVHMPIDGTLTHTIYIPGKSFSVNPLAATHIPGLFARNERLVCLFHTAVGPMAVIFIGAMLVGKIETIWGLVERSNHVVTRTYIDSENIFLAKGEELGRFNMGSSVIMLFGKNHMQWLPELQQQSSVQMGKAMGKVKY